MHRIILAAILAACSGTSGLYLPAKQQTTQNQTKANTCDQSSQFISEAQLFVNNNNNYPVVLIESRTSYFYTFVSETNELNTSPINTNWSGSPDEQENLRPGDSKSWNIAPSKSVSIQQALDNFDNGVGVQVQLTSCEESQIQLHRFHIKK